MAEWKVYDGSDEQIAEINAARHRNGFSVKWESNGKQSEVIINLDASEVWGHARFTHYLICEPHPLADMICQQARTGQEVWVRRPAHRFEWDRVWGNLVVDYIKTEQTTTPDWNIPNAEYSFTPFEEGS